MHIPCSSPTNLRSIPSGLFPENWKVPASDAGREACVLEAASSHAGFLPRGRTVTGASNRTGASGLRSVPSDLRGNHGLGLESEVGILLRTPPHLCGVGETCRGFGSPPHVCREPRRNRMSLQMGKNTIPFSLCLFLFHCFWPVGLLLI